MPATLADIQRKYGDSVYPLYKELMQEPYMDMNNGEGYAGTVLYDEEQDKILCAECGKWFKALAVHLRIHSINTNEYKDKFSLLRKTPLCRPETSRMASIRAVKTNFGNYGKKNHLFSTKGKANNFGKKMQYKNRFGLCDAQIVSRLIIVRDELGLSTVNKLKLQDIKKLDSSLYGAMKKRYKTHTNIIKTFKLLKSGGARKVYLDTPLLAQLRRFVRANKRIPLTEDFENAITIKKYFCSWNRAKMMAGLEQLLVEVLEQQAKVSLYSNEKK